MNNTLLINFVLLFSATIALMCALYLFFKKPVKKQEINEKIENLY